MVWEELNFVGRPGTKRKEQRVRKPEPHPHPPGRIKAPPGFADLAL